MLISEKKNFLNKKKETEKKMEVCFLADQIELIDSTSRS